MNRSPSATGLSRRHFITGASAVAALSNWPALRALADQHWDAIIVGGGTAGLPAALFAARRGKVLVLDRAAVMGGTLDRSSGQVAAAGTLFQAEKGIDDTPDAHYEDIMRINGGTSDPALTRLFVEHAADALNWLAEAGYRVLPDHPVTGASHDHYTTRRYQWGKENGRTILAVLEPMIRAAEQRGSLKLLLNTAAVDLMLDDRGAVTGVVAEDATGARIDFRADNVVLASGGCAANPIMYEELHGVPLYCQIANPNSQGIGITLGLGAGGRVRGGDKYATLTGAILSEDRFPAPLVAMPTVNTRAREPWEIHVNADGQRFVQEDHPSVDHFEKALLQQPGHRHWAVFDETILRSAPPLIPDWDADRIRNECGKHPMFQRADSMGELAIQSGVHPRHLAATVAAYNDALVAKRPDPFNRGHRPLPIAEPPFYAVRLQGWTLISFAGLDVNERLQVIDTNGAAVPNLFAAGEVIGAAATSGFAYTNGMLVTPAVTFGRLLGDRILPIG